VFLLVWLCLTLLLVYVWVSPDVLCDWRSSLCKYVGTDSFGYPEWAPLILMTLILYFLTFLFSFPFVAMYWIWLIVESWIYKKSNV